MSIPLPGPLVSVDWLRAQRDAADLVILDASWHMPASGRSAADEFRSQRLPGARFFDFDGAIRDRSSSLPHMLPAADEFEAAVRALGVNRDSRVICYDSLGVFAAPRAWWMFRAMGHAEVAVLDGGLPAWQAAGLSLETGAPANAAVGDFVARPEPRWLVALDDVRRALDEPTTVVLDARGAGRFQGREPEPRSGLRSGHMPGARNLPFTALLADGRFRAGDELRALFAAQAADGQRLICSCGSGVTACVLALGATLAGWSAVAVYDGSWTEWGGRSDTPVVTGA